MCYFLITPLRFFSFCMCVCECVSVRVFLQAVRHAPAGACRFYTAGIFVGGVKLSLFRGRSPEPTPMPSQSSPDPMGGFYDRRADPPSLDRHVHPEERWTVTTPSDPEQLIMKHPPMADFYLTPRSVFFLPILRPERVSALQWGDCNLF